MSIIEKLKNNKQLIFNVGLLIVLWLSIPVLIINKGLFYSDYNNSIEIHIKSEDSEDFIKAKELFGFSRLNEEQRLITLQKKNIEEVTKKFEETFRVAESEEAKFEIKELISAEDLVSDIKDLSIAAVFIIFTTFISSFYIFFRKNKKVTLLYLIKVFFVALFVVIIASSIYFGLLSFLSSIYQVRTFEVNLALIMPLILSMSFAFTLSKGVDTFREFVTVSRFQSRNFLKFVAITFFLVSIPMLFALGLKFVITSILTSIVLLLPFLALIFFCNIYNLVEEYIASRNEDESGSTLHKTDTSSTKKIKSYTPRFKKKAKNQK